MDGLKLFSGEPLPRGGLSNEEELTQSCPHQFLESHNSWTDYIARTAFWGRDDSTWKWKSSDVAIQKRQKSCMDAMLDSRNLKMSVKNAIAAWMLSEMLSEVPPNN
jgi:lipid II:glycine glycyltransferase (peptidoglycan interpeptide bridge formation enzyme)